MKINFNLKLHIVFLLQIVMLSSSAQNSIVTTNSKITGVAEPMKKPVIFDIETTHPRFMQRGPSKLTVDLKDIWKLKQNPPSDIEIDRKPRTPIFLGVQLNTDLKSAYGPGVKSNSKTFSSYLIADSTEATIIALGITSENVNNFKYHVVENDSIEIISWSQIPEIVQDSGYQRMGDGQFENRELQKQNFSYANLGTFHSLGKQLLIEVVNTNDYSLRDGIILDWRMNLKPIVTQIMVRTQNDYYNLNSSKINRGYVTEFDLQTGMPQNLSIPADSIVGFGFTFKNHITVPYKLTLIKNLEKISYATEIGTYFLDDKYDFYCSYFNEPGDYELVIEPMISGRDKFLMDQKLSFKFKVLPPPSKAKTFSFIQISIWGSGALLLLGLLFSVYYFFNKRKLLKTRQQKELVTLKLKSIQSQFNPHFMFNALNSIQNLMNKNDIEGANRYLGKFSGLARKVLDSGDDEMISLEDELKILEDYIQMEQLRFGFLYEIVVDNNINAGNFEVPTMLLQPFVENAVKHGVSAINKNGKIQISVSGIKNDIYLSVEDNGTGFTKESINKNSKGIKLVKERITLLNQSFGSQSIELEVNSGKNGTKVILKLKNWI